MEEGGPSGKRPDCEVEGKGGKKVQVRVTQSCLTLCDPRPEYWSG